MKVLMGTCKHCGKRSILTSVGWECTECFCPDVSETEVVEEFEVIEVKVMEYNHLWGASLL